MQSMWEPEDGAEEGDASAKQTWVVALQGEKQQ